MSKQELELPKGWTKTTLSQISLINPKKSARGSVDDELEVSFLPMKCVEELTGQYDLSNNKKYSEVKKGYTYFKNGDIIFAKITPCMENGKIAIVDNLKNDMGFGSTEFHVIRLNDELIRKYYFYYLIQDNFRYIAKQSMSGTAGQLRVSSSYLKETLIPLPPLNEQKRIVSKIEELFSKIDSTKQSLEQTKLQLELYRQSLLKYAFEGKLTEDWRTETKSIPDIEWIDYEKQKTTIMKIYNENLKDIVIITNDWYWLNIKSLSESMKNGIYKEKKFYTDDGIACLRMYNIENWKLIWKKIKRLDLTSDEISEYELKPDDILFNRVNSMELVGKAAFIPKNIEQCVYESKNIRLRFKTKYIKPKFVHMWLLFASRHYFNKNFQQTTGMASVNQGQLGDLPIPYCSLEEQEQIVSQIEQGFSLIENTTQIVNSTLQTLQTMKMSVLKHAFEGKLVPQDPNDEPAEKLLERIKKEKS